MLNLCDDELCANGQMGEERGWIGLAEAGFGFRVDQWVDGVGGR